MLEVDVIEQLDGLRECQADWQGLHQSLAGATPFNSPAWVLNWLDCFAPEQALHCVRLSRQGKWRAILPLVRQPSRWRRLPVQAWSACTNAHNVRNALLCQPTERLLAAGALWRSLQARHGWDLLLLDGCNAASQERMAELPSELPAEAWQHAGLRLQGSWADYLATRSHDLRRNLRRSSTDLNRLGALRLSLLEHDAAQLYEQWLVVDRASWKQQGGETLDCDARTATYYRRMLQLLAEQGQLLGALLYLDANPIAVLIAARHQGVLYTLKTAMRDDLGSARISLGTLLMGRLLEHAWQRGDVSRVDFLSAAPYAGCWSNEMLAFERRAALARSLRGQAVGLLDRLAQGFQSRKDIELCR